jgi:hypothetical protein
MHKGFGESVENTFIEIGILPGELKGDIFSALFGDVADDARKAAEKLFHWHHSNLQHTLVKLIEDARLKGHGVRKLGTQRVAGMLLVKLG